MTSRIRTYAADFAGQYAPSRSVLSDAQSRVAKPFGSMRLEGLSASAKPADMPAPLRTSDSPASFGVVGSSAGIARPANFARPTRPPAGLMKAMRLCLSVFLSLLLIAMQPALPGALRLTPTYTTEAQALEGTTNYSDMFHLSQRRGTPGYISGSTLRTVSTYSNSDYVYDSNRRAWMSSAAFTSNQPVSLLHDWVIECEINKPAVSINTSINSEVIYQYVFGLFKNNNAESLNGQAVFMVDRYSASGGYETFLIDRNVSGSLSSGNIGAQLDMGNSPTRSSVTISYSYAANALTMRYGSYAKTLTSVRSTFPSQAYLGMWGTFNWNNKNGSTTVAQAPSGAYLDVTFKSMSMPHLEPSIESLSVYPESGDTPYGKDAMLENGAVVRVECTVKNKYANPGSEQYPVYLKTVNDAAHPTQGVAPFIDSRHPLTVKQGTATLSSVTGVNANTVLGTNGTPITLVGSNEYKVTYYATINQGSGEAVKLSQCLGENSFHGTYYETIELFSEKALVEGPDAAAGANYSRVPGANANGWNAGPVDIKFHVDDVFDEFDIKDDAGELVKTLTADDAKWGVVGDTSGVSLTYQGRNTDIGIKSIVKPDVIRIDTHTPTLAYDKATNTLVASDVPADDAHATSGIWKIVRVDSQDIVASPSDVRQGVVYKGTNGVWASEATLSSPYPGTYVAIDAAGNVSGEIEVASLGLPSVARPASGGNNGGDGSEGDGSGDEAYTGPVFAGAVPEGEVTVDENGLNHRVIQEGIFEVVDGSMDRGDLPFGGTLDMDSAKQLIDHNYSFKSDADGDSSIDVTVELIDARTGKPVGSVDTSKTGEYIVRATATDAQGNTTTVDVVCRFANKDDLPQVTPKPGTPNPDDPFGELIVKGDEKEPSPLEVKDVKLNEETGKVTGMVEASLYVPRSDTVATPGDVAMLISNRYSIDSLIGAGNDSTIKRGQVVLKDSNGNIIEGIDLSKTGTWTAEQTFTDNLGNETTLRVTITNKKKGSGSANLSGDTDTPSINITPSTDVRLDPESVGTVKDEPYFEHDPDKPLNVLDVLQVRPEDAEDWSAITDSGSNGSGDGTGDDGNGGGSSDGSGDGTGDGSNGSGDGTGTNPGGTTPQLPGNVKVTVTDEAGKQVDETNITNPGTYTVTVSVKDPDTDEYMVIETLTFHVVDTSITDTDYIYKDVPKDHWGHGYIFDIGPSVINGAFNPSEIALGYMAGYAGTTNFGPYNDIIRGDAAIVVWRMAGCPDVEGDEGQDDSKPLSLANTYHTGFSDCDANPTMYYNKAIAWCAANGIVEGYGDTGLYLPQNQITREEFASIIARYAAFKGKDVSSALADLSQYPDIDDVSDWAITNMHYVVSSGIMTGKGTDEGTADGTHGILDPQAHVTRAEVAKMTYMEQPTRP